MSRLNASLALTAKTLRRIRASPQVVSECSNHVNHEGHSNETKVELSIPEFLDWNLTRESSFRILVRRRVRSLLSCQQLIVRLHPYQCLGDPYMYSSSFRRLILFMVVVDLRCWLARIPNHNLLGLSCGSLGSNWRPHYRGTHASINMGCHAPRNRLNSRPARQLCCSECCGRSPLEVTRLGHGLRQRRCGSDQRPASALHRLMIPNGDMHWQQNDPHGALKRSHNFALVSM